MTDFGTYTPLDDIDLLSDKTINSAPKHSPIFTDYRVLNGTADGVDSGDIIVRRRGMVMAGFEKAIVRVIPGVASDPTIDILFWSESDTKFVAANPALQAVGLGVGVAYDYLVEVHGRIIFVYVTGTFDAADDIEIQIAGFGVMPEP
jgi:hypothetical protein